MERAIYEPMKIKGCALGLAATGLFCISTFASPSDPASELRHQDSAFSLLIEAFRQMQSYLIQSDYESRLKAADGLSDLKARRQVTVLAQEERDLRLKKLYGQLGNLTTAYDLSHQRDEREAGIEAPAAIDTTAAAETLKDFVVITPVTGNQVDSSRFSVQPATTVLLDTRPR